MIAKLPRSQLSRNGFILYGHVATAVSIALAWFAIWTTMCNALVLGGFHYPSFLWALLITTITTASVASFFYRRIVEIYTPTGDSVRDQVNPTRPLSIPLLAALLTAAVTAFWTQRTTSPLPYIGGTALITLIIHRSACRVSSTGIGSSNGVVGGQFFLLILVLIALYYFSHRAEADDSAFVNLAIGAQRTVGGVFQFDTMLGDGPRPIILPTYKFHSFELLGAALSSVTGLEPIAVFHLLLPLPELTLLAAIMLLAMWPVAGRNWFAAALLWIAFLFLNEATLAGWGVHGIVRLFEGKAFLVSALIPIIATLTVRWFQRGERIDLLALLICNICAVGFSANGLYGGPLASAFVAAAFVASAPLSPEVWRRAIGLLPTISYPAAVAAIIVLFRLALPSEFSEPSGAVEALCFVAGFGLAGHLVLALIALGGVGLISTGFARAGLTYVPLTMLLTLNPYAWSLINAFTGMLGIRVFWSLPAAPLSALLTLKLLEHAGILAVRCMIAVAAIILALTIGWNAWTSGPMTEIKWHSPDLKVVRPDYDLAQLLASKTDPTCSILAPERISQWLTTIRDSPYPVFARELYLIHYRFTMSPTERDVRERLRRVVDGTPLDASPLPAELTAAGIHIGTVAVDRAAPSRRAAESLARRLGLDGPLHDGNLLVWSGPCQ